MYLEHVQKRYIEDCNTADFNKLALAAKAASEILLVAYRRVGTENCHIFIIAGLAASMLTMPSLPAEGVLHEYIYSLYGNVCGSHHFHVMNLAKKRCGLGLSIPGSSFFFVLVLHQRYS